MTIDPGYPVITDCKQEVIEILRGLTMWIVPVKDYPNLEESYDRIAPLIRGEFPEEVVTKIVSHYLGGCENVRDNRRSIERMYLNSIYDEQIGTLAQLCIAALKCLWEGQEAKGTCQTCGGSGQQPFMSGDGPDMDICPQCDGIGEERRSGEERRARFREITINGREFYFDEIDNKQTTYRSSRRILKDRRKQKEGSP